MNAAIRRALPLALLATSSLAFASGHLTQHQCSRYPLASAHGALTSRDVARELSELESVGYRPGIDNYSPDIGDARARLMAQAAKDCLPTQAAAGNASTSG
jgi:hypothetical protein